MIVHLRGKDSDDLREFSAVISEMTGKHTGIVEGYQANGRSGGWRRAEHRGSARGSTGAESSPAGMEITNCVAWEPAVGKPFSCARARMHVLTRLARWPTRVCQREGGMLCSLR